MDARLDVGNLSDTTLEGAEAVCSGHGVELHDTFDVLARLVDRSLVARDAHEDHPRYRMLETIRVYAAEALANSGKQAFWQEHHLNYYLELAEQAAPLLRSEQDIIWMDILERDHDNLRSALDRTSRTENTRAALSLVSALFYFWYRGGYIREGKNRILQALASGKY